MRISYKNGKGSLQIDFYSDEQLAAYARLLGQYDPESAGQTDVGEDPGAEHWEG